MKRYIGLLLILVVTMLSACNDDPKITFRDYSGTYTIDNGMSLNLTVDGFTITDTGSGVEFKTNGNSIAEITLNRVIEGHGTITVAGVIITPLPDGKGISFEGQAAISETEKIIFKGMIIGTAMTLDVNKIQISNDE